MMDKTDEFSFVLAPSENGVGVFATHDIQKGTFLRLFGDKETWEEIWHEENRLIKKDGVPQKFQDYCIKLEDEIIAPADFGRMRIGWYMNHSEKPNAGHKDFLYYAIRDIRAGEEITADYGTLEEPESDQEKFYQKS